MTFVNVLIVVYSFISSVVKVYKFFRLMLDFCLIYSFVVTISLFFCVFLAFQLLQILEMKKIISIYFVFNYTPKLKTSTAKIRTLCGFY